MTEAIRPPSCVSPKKRPAQAGLKIGGLNDTRNTTLARSVHAPGGWGAEESGARSRPGLEATACCFAVQLGVCWAEMGPHYD